LSNESVASFSWNIDTTGLILQELTYNLTVKISRGNIVTCVENVNTTNTTMSGIKPLTNYTLTIQSKNKYTLSSTAVKVPFITPGIFYLL